MSKTKTILSKNNKCYVPGCKSGYITCSTKVSLFKAPTNECERKLWENSISRTDKILSVRDVICEKHFHKHEIIRCFIVENVKFPYSRPRLIKGAIPTLFDYKSPPNIDLDPDLEIPGITETPKPTIFENIYSNPSMLNLHANWGIFPINNRLLLSKMKLEDGLPIMERQMVINSELSVKYFLGNREIIDGQLFNLPCTIVANLENIEKAINNFSKINLDNLGNGIPSGIPNKII